METDSEPSSDESEAEETELPEAMQPSNELVPEANQPTQQLPPDTDPIAELVAATTAEENANEQTLSATDEAAEPVVQSQPAQDDVVADATAVSRDESAEMSEDYEPPEAEESSSGDTSSFSPAPVADGTVPAVNDETHDETHDVTAAIPITKPISSGRQESPSAAAREVANIPN